MAIDRATIGGTLVTGKQVRAASNEPRPDPSSPGLNIPQLVNVAFGWHVELTNRTRGTWSSLMAALKDRQGVILQGDADQLPPQYNGQTGFKGNHCVYINHEKDDTGAEVWWMDPLNKQGSFYIPTAVARAYAEKLAKAAGIFPGVFFATTRSTPSLA
jgi:hypothetical protein